MSLTAQAGLLTGTNGPLWWGHDGQGSGRWEISEPFSQFGSDPNTAIKKINIYIHVYIYAHMLENLTIPSSDPASPRTTHTLKMLH